MVAYLQRQQIPSDTRPVLARAAAFDSVSFDDLLPTKLELLKKVACLNRGAIASSNDNYEVSSFVEVMEDAAGQLVQLDAVQGKWELVYSSVEPFRSSPFFWAFQEGLVQSREVATQIFAFTDSIPGAHIGAAYQTISFDTAKLISEVDLEVFPGIRGTVVTTSMLVQEPPRSLAVTVQNTRVANSNVLPFVDNITPSAWSGTSVNITYCRKIATWARLTAPSWAY
ncbi:hypothetical protein VOLCADRAFT_119281 [Volvox carteri f. nagariensis]|uniref:Plastid lipid-associated protein/fibrillin conserved domain-containing protein n=1 Tax=Volvox carteri f. nagariensis TaxID=3068 RepID=D8UBR3_VOLCA|nr:uncharacterized protein VOLCADRAFT_119281 [Volvox carteri f. nagariensis]EFJ42869.1 hypothetical protein VOLCADRAFT_119281 [Volvox carteri f. nagariensis]|eukprot:XP_002956129.1 hypothetical protein VOLCADRAFT_119281 [Volvox carteri f. nagariensis]